MPLRAFWNLNKQVSRLRAEERLEQIELFLLASQTTNGKVVDSYRSSLMQRIGDTVKENKSFVPKDIHKTGIEKLKGIRSRIREENGEPK